MINDFLNLTESPDIPDLIPTGLMFDEILDVNNVMMPTITYDLTELNQKFEHLTVELNTLNLRLEIEKAKRQRLQSTVRQLKRETLSPCPDVLTIKRELNEFKDQQTTINYMLDGENAKTSTLAFRSISRLCQLVGIIMQGTYVTTEAIDEANTLLHELTLTIRQFGVHYAASHV